MSGGQVSGEAVLRVAKAGPGVTLQDGGRWGFLRFGVTPAGPMDPLAFATANWLAGNAPGSTAIEVSLGGVDLVAEDGPVGLGYAGGRFALTLDDEPLPSQGFVTVAPGARLSVRAGTAGAWCTLAPAGALVVEPFLGSTATHTRSGFGGLDGRALASGDHLRVRTRDGGPTIATVDTPWLERPTDLIRVMLGPQDDYFSPDAIAAFFAGPWTIGARSDRMACFLQGPRLSHAKGYNIVSDGIAMGAIQVPGEGQPIVLMADRQPTGGYPKIATVIGADFGRLAQARAGTAIGFAPVSADVAVAARRRQAEAFRQPAQLLPVARKNLRSVDLLRANLVDGYLG